MGQGKKESMPATRIRMGKSNRMLSIICYVVVGLFAAVCLFPFALMITSSFMTEKEIVSEGYKLIQRSGQPRRTRICSIIQRSFWTRIRRRYS